METSLEATKTTGFLDSALEQLQNILKPLQNQVNQRQKKVDFMKQCTRSIEKNDFFLLDEQLTGKLAKIIIEDPELESCQAIFCKLEEYAKKQIDLYRIDFQKALVTLAEESGLKVKVDLPRLNFLKGIEGEVNFGTRQTSINKTVIKSVDPRRIISTVLKKKRQLYERPYDPQNFIDGLFRTYIEIIKKAKFPMGESISIRDFYKEHVLSLQSKAFFQNMDKGKFKGYCVEQFAVDLWRYFEAALPGTSNHHCIKLNGGRGASLWLIDQNGERRQITHLSFSQL
jgi:hypothetical protein